MNRNDQCKALLEPEMSYVTGGPIALKKAKIVLLSLQFGRERASDKLKDDIDTATRKLGRKHR